MAIKHAVISSDSVINLTEALQLGLGNSYRLQAQDGTVTLVESSDEPARHTPGWRLNEDASGFPYKQGHENLYAYGTGSVAAMDIWRE